MKVLLYNQVINFYYLMIRLAAATGNKKAKLWIEGRKNIFHKIIETVNSSEKHIWVHCASLGEFEQGLPVIEKVKEKYPSKKIIVTFFSPSGYEIRKNYDKADYVFYLPFDTKSNAEKFITLINPEFAIFVKYEYWFHYFNELIKRNIPVYLISVIIREDHWLLGSFGKMHMDIFRKVNHFFVQDEKTKLLLNNKGVDKVTVAGDTRFDRVWEVVQKSKSIPLVEQFVNKSKCLVAGSTWKDDEKILKEYFKTHKEIKLIIAPHEINDEHLKYVEKIFKNSIRFSMANEENVKNFKVLIIDNIGMLSSLYAYADVTYVGGGFGRGIHNILEPAAHSKPVLFGPDHQNFREANLLIKSGAGFEVNDAIELKLLLDKLFSDDNYLKECSEKAGEFVRENKGASEIIMGNIILD